jgi:hypothetical protein
MSAVIFWQVSRRKRWISHGEAKGPASDLSSAMQLKSSEWKIGTYWKGEVIEEHQVRVRRLLANE